MPENCRRLEDSQVCGDGLDDLPGKRGVIKRVPEQRGFLPQKVVLEPPIVGDFFNALELAGIPGDIIWGQRAVSGRRRRRQRKG